MKKITVYTLVLLSLFSCKKAFMDSSLATNDRYQNFDYLWNEIDKKYSFFDLKGLDWNQIKAKYRSMIVPGMSDEAFFEVMGAMVNELKDGHSNLFSPINNSFYPIHEPLLGRLFPGSQSTGAFSHDWIGGEAIGYIRFSSFMSDVDEKTLDYVLGKYKTGKGLILDLRGNGGGNAATVNVLLGRFTSEPRLVGYEQMRNGKDHKAFTEPNPVYVTPKGTFFSPRVVVLTDRGSYSATTYFALSVKAFPNITLMGDTTGGGGGMPNGGELPNGWTYRFSITRLLDANKQNYAESGVPPDILVSFDWSDLERDEVIEAAVNFLK
jgi:C-terminal processing protease CtpA/Prc